MLIRIFQIVEWFYKVKEDVPDLECLFLMFFSNVGCYIILIDDMLLILRQQELGEVPLEVFDCL